MASPNWPGTAGFPAFPFRKQFSRKSIQLPWATVNGETDAPEIIWGATASPEGAVVGSPGDVYVPTLSGDSSIWRKKTGVETNTGWIQISAQAVVGGGGGTGTGSAFAPLDPFIAQVTQQGDATHPALVHLKNPSASGKLTTIYELLAAYTGAGSVTVKVRRTASPIALAGANQAVAVPVHLDERSVVAVTTEFAGCDAPATTFTEANSQFACKIAGDGAAGFTFVPIRSPGAFPWIVKEGSAVELLLDTNGAAVKLRVLAIWDDIAVPA